MKAVIISDSVLFTTWPKMDVRVTHNVIHFGEVGNNVGDLAQFVSLNQHTAKDLFKRFRTDLIDPESFEIDLPFYELVAVENWEAAHQYGQIIDEFLEFAKTDPGVKEMSQRVGPLRDCDYAFSSIQSGKLSPRGRAIMEFYRIQKG